MVRVGVYVRNKDECNIIEFMEHYYSLGFEFILMIDDYSKIHPSTIIGDKFAGKYKIIQIDKSIVDRQPFYLNQADIFNSYILPELKQYMDFCLYVDMDEYLVIKNYKHINEVIDFYKPFDQLKINWLLFGNNNIKKCEDLSKIKPLFTSSSLYFNNHVKSLVNINNIIHNHCPHAFISNGITKNTLNEITDDTAFDYKLINYSFKDINIYIAHYVTQDTFSFVKRRLCRFTSTIVNIINKLNYVEDKSFIKRDLLNYTNSNINNIVDYVNGEHDDVNIFLDIYREHIASFKIFFKCLNSNEINNYDLLN